METVKESVEKMRQGETVLPRPEEGVFEPGVRRNLSSRHEASPDPRAGSDLDAIPDRAVGDACSRSRRHPAEHASGGLEAAGSLERQETPRRIELPAGLRERSATVERFERRAEEIARAAQIGEWPPVQEPSDLLASAREKRTPEVGDERGFSGRDLREDSRRHHADAGVEEGPAPPCSEPRDPVAVGLKRRVPVGIPILRDQQCCRPAGPPVLFDERREIGLDGRVRVDDEKVSSAKPCCGVSQRACGAQDARLREEAQLAEVRRAIAKLAFDLFAKMMKIDACFEDAVPPEARQMLPDQGNVEKREERLRDHLGDRRKARASTCREEEGPHIPRETS
jgi:hypothetical protein